MNEYGEVFKECRLKRGMTQEELAHRLYIQQADVSRIERNKKEPTLSLAIKWAQVTGSEDVIAALIVGMDALPMLTDIVTTTLQMIYLFV